MELGTDNCRNLTVFLEVVVSIVASLLTHEVVEVEDFAATCFYAPHVITSSHDIICTVKWRVIDLQTS